MDKDQPIMLHYTAGAHKFHLLWLDLCLRVCKCTCEAVLKSMVDCSIRIHLLGSLL